METQISQEIEALNNKIEAVNKKYERESARVAKAVCQYFACYIIFKKNTKVITEREYRD